MAFINSCQLNFAALLRPITNLLTLCLSLLAPLGANAQDYAGYLMAHFTGETPNGEQIYFATSTDGLHWTDINKSFPVLNSDIGENGVRDPALIRSQDGSKFWLLATDLRIANGYGWTVAQQSGSTNLVIWESTDLVNWSEPRLVDVAGSIAGAGCAWAPEAIYDDELGQYVVYWATISPIAGLDKARMFYATTSDFVTFSAPQVYIDRSGTEEIIDTQILEINGSNYRYVRASRDLEITFEGSNSILGSWTTLGDLSGLGLSGSDVEGPILYTFNGGAQWGMMVDQYATGGGYLPLTTTTPESPSTFAVVSSTDYSLGTSHKRHGSILPITAAELTAVTAMGLNSDHVPLSQIESYANPGSFVRHYDFDARIDSGVSPVADAQWRIVPGLADPSGYVSFESVNFPGYYLRHYGFDLEASPYDGTDVFVADASFKITGGLADHAYSSFQSYNYPDRYIRVVDGYLLLAPISTTAEQQQATFQITTADSFAGQAFYIRNRNSGKCLSSLDGASADGTSIVQYTCGSNDYEQWVVRYAGNDEYVLVQVSSGKPADITASATTNGADHVIWSNSEASSQKWQILDQGDGYYHIVNVNSGLLLDISGASTADNGNSIQWPDNGGYNQDWEFVAVD